MKKISALLIILSGFLWGIMGIFTKIMEGIGFSSPQTSCVRLCVTTIAMGILIFFKDKSMFKFEIKNIYIFILNGVISVYGMSTLYLYTIVHTSLSTASILLYTSPIWVILISTIFLHEKITWQKAVAVVSAFIGCVIVSGMGNSSNAGLFFILTGIGGGISYGLYSIFGSIALKKYHPYTLTFYSFLFASITALIATPPAGIVQVVSASSNVWYTIGIMVATGIETAFLPFLVYTMGLKGTEPGKAAIMACVDPMVATITGFFVYGQKASILGIAFILFAVLLVNNFGIRAKK